MFYRRTDGGINHVWWIPHPPEGHSNFYHDQWSGPGGRGRIDGHETPATAGDPVTMVYVVEELEQRMFYRSIGGICHVHWHPGVSVLPTDPLPADQPSR